MFVWKDKNKQKEAEDGPFKKNISVVKKQSKTAQTQYQCFAVIYGAKTTTELRKKVRSVTRWSKFAAPEGRGVL